MDDRWDPIIDRIERSVDGPTTVVVANTVQAMDLQRRLVRLGLDLRADVLTLDDLFGDEVRGVAGTRIMSRAIWMPDALAFASDRVRRARAVVQADLDRAAAMHQRVERAAKNVEAARC